MRARSASAPSPSSSARPGRRLCRKTSARSASRSSASRPRGSRSESAERALARVGGEEHRALAVPERRSPGAAVVARVRSLDLDDVGAERGEDLRAVRPGDRRRHVEHAHAGERLVGHAPIIAARPLCDDGEGVRHARQRRLRRVVELPRRLRRRDGGRVLPARPERDGRDHAGRARRLRRPQPAALHPRAQPAARSPATTSATASAAWLGEHTVKRFFRSEKSHKGFDWAEQHARRARHLPHHHRALHPGRPHGGRRSRPATCTSFPYRRFVRRRCAAPAPIWGSYTVLLGYVGGKTFEDAPWKGLLLAFAVALAVTGGVELVRHPCDRRRGLPSEPAPTVGAEDGRGGRLAALQVALPGAVGEPAREEQDQRRRSRRGARPPSGWSSPALAKQDRLDERQQREQEGSQQPDPLGSTRRRTRRGAGARAARRRARTRGAGPSSI